jgi:hypothetical protein
VKKAILRAQQQRRMENGRAEEEKRLIILDEPIRKNN